MFSQMLYVQWRWSRDLLAFFVVAGFAIPLLTAWIILPQLGTPAAHELIETGSVIGWFCLGLAMLAGGSIALQGYGADDRGGHIYALSLPVARSRFLGTRTLSAFLILALPAAAVGMGAALVAANVDVPATLQAYPVALAFRVLLAAWLAHACVFALRYAAGRRMKIVFFVLLLVVVGTLLLSVLAPDLRVALSRAGTFLGSHPGPFGVLFDRWTLFDV